MTLVKQHHHGQRDRGEEPAGQRRVAGGAFDQRQGDRVDAEQPAEVGDGDPAREEVGGDQGRPDEDRAVLADGDAALVDQQPGQRRGARRGSGGWPPAGSRRARSQAEQAGDGHRRGGARSAPAVSPPLGCGRTSERATSAGAGRAAAAPTARASERPGVLSAYLLFE